jgi:hypothetical protein
MGLLNAILGQNMASGIFSAAQANGAGMLANTAQIQGSSVHYPERPRMKNKTLFSGRVEVQQVTNGYIVNIATREGYEFDTYIAATVKDVNDIISTAIVAFRLEDV